LVREIAALSRLRVIVALGGLAFDETLRALAAAGVASSKPKPRFSHRAECALGPFVLLGAYHPSQQNTFTGKLTPPMLRAVFRRARALAELPAHRSSANA